MKEKPRASALRISNLPCKRLDENPQAWIQKYATLPLKAHMQIDTEPEVHWARRYASEIGVGFIVLAVVVLGLAIWSALRESEEKPKAILTHEVSSLAPAQLPTPPPSPQPFEWTGNIDSTRPWQSISLNVQRGNLIRITASGSVMWDPQVPPPDNQVGPNGASYTPATTKPLPPGSDPNLYNFPMNSAPCASLVMKIGQHVYFVGSSAQIYAQEEGYPAFMVNDRYGFLSDNVGKFHVQVEVFP